MIPIAKPLIGEEEIEAVIRVLRSGILVLGNEVEAFEREFADYVGVKHGVATANGTAALDLALKALRLREGDEVITTPFSFIASANAILYQGAKPVFADIDERTFNIDPDDVLEKVTERTRGVLVVHLYGQPADMAALAEICEDRGLYLIEDCAQAHGAEFGGKRVGSFGDVSAFSFYATKNMTTGEGGMVLTDSRELAEKVKLLRNHGQVRKYVHEELGYNLRMTEICAAIGRAQLRKLDGWNLQRAENVRLLSEGIRGIRGLTPPYVDPRVKHVFHQYTIRVEEDFPMGRDELSRSLNGAGVGTAVHYPIPIHLQSLYRRLGYDERSCPKAIEASKRVLSLPVHPALSRGEIAHIIRALERAARS